MTSRALAPILFLGLATTACGTSPPPSDTQPTDAADTMTASGLPGDRYCSAGTSVTCNAAAGQVATCGVCVTPTSMPTERLVRTPCAQLSMGPSREYCDRTATVPTPANLACYSSFDPMNPPPLAMTQMVTIWGVADVFGTGGDSQHVRVEVFEVGAEGTPGRSLGFDITDTARMWSEEEDELDNSGNVRTHRRLGAYSIPNIPTERPLVIVTRGDPSDAMAARDFFAHPIYDYTLAIRNSEIGRVPEYQMGRTIPPSITGPAVYIRARVLANADWTIIPSTAALPTGIPVGHGAVAGEVHDCDDVRLSNATVYINPAPNFESTVYFSDNDTRPLPDMSRSSRGTQILGLYAMLDVTPGPVRVAAVGYDANGQLVHSGFYQARVFPDAVTTVTVRGLRPWQVQR